MDASILAEMIAAKEITSREVIETFIRNLNVMFEFNRIISSICVNINFGRIVKNINRILKLKEGSSNDG